MKYRQDLSSELALASPSPGRRTLLAGATILAVATLRGQGAVAEEVMRQPLPGPNPQQLRKAALPGASLEYWDTGGDGQVVILLHPATGSHAMWGYQQPAFVQAGYRVIAYSRRGYLGSDSGPADDPGSASDDLERLADHLRINRFHAVGSAQGSIVATDFALSRASRLRSLSLTCTIMGVQDPAYQSLSASLRPQGFAALPASFRELGPSYRAANPEGVAAWYELEKIAIPERRVIQRNTNRITWEALGNLRVPVLLLGGEADLWSPPSLYRRFQAAIPGSELVILSEAGHAAHWEQPRAFNASVLNFIGRHQD
jgi:pimeloyl-ACP methyl ester carboxylesterase